MAVHGKATGILLGGYDLTPMLNAIGTPSSLDVAEVTPFGSTAKSYIPGVADATVTMGGFYEGTMEATEELLDTVASTGEVILVSYGRAITVGQTVKFAKVIRSAFEVTGSVSDAVGISGAAQADGGLHTGTVLAAKQAVSTTPVNGSTVDGGASSANGGHAALHITANDRDGDVTVTVQHSTDGSVWVDKGTFTVVATDTLASEVIDLAGTINRYVRAVVTLAGSTGSATVTVALSRG